MTRYTGCMITLPSNSTLEAHNIFATCSNKLLNPAHTCFKVHQEDCIPADNMTISESLARHDSAPVKTRRESVMMTLLRCFKGTEDFEKGELRAYILETDPMHIRM